MRGVLNWKGGMAAVALTLSLGAAGVTQAQQPLTVPMAVTENRAPGVAGQTTITPLGNNQIRVDARLTGLQPNAEHAFHIHSAPGAVCDNNAPVTYPLTNVRADASGVGTSSTTVTLVADRPVNANNAYVNAHQGASPPGQGVICGNITTSFTFQAGGGQAAGAPRTGTGFGQGAGGTSAALFGGVAALLVLAGGAGLRVIGRRR